MNTNDISTAVRDYIEAEWRGAALVMSAKRGEIIAAILAADPSLSNTAASFRFHNLVAEMRDNDSIEPQHVPAADGADIHVHGDTCSIPCEVPARKPAPIEQGTRIKVTKGRYANTFQRVDAVQPNGSVMFLLSGRKFYAAPGAFEVIATEEEFQHAAALPTTHAATEAHIANAESAAVASIAEFNADGPRFPEGTPEYDAYRAELAAELAKFKAGEAPYEYGTEFNRSSGLARLAGLTAPKPAA